MEEESLLLDNGFRDQYALLMEVAAQVPEERKILITRVGYQYALRGRGYLLTANPIVPLMNLEKDAVGAALAEMNVALLATEPDFWDERYYPLSTLNDYLSGLPRDPDHRNGKDAPVPAGPLADSVCLRAGLTRGPRHAMMCRAHP